MEFEEGHLDPRHTRSFHVSPETLRALIDDAERHGEPLVLCIDSFGLVGRRARPHHGAANDIPVRMLRREEGR